MDDLRHLKMADIKEGVAAATLDEFLDKNAQRHVELLVKKNEENVSFINRRRKFVCDNNMCFSCVFLVQQLF